MAAAKDNKKIESIFEYEGYGFKGLVFAGEDYMTLNMVYRVVNNRRVYLKTMQSIGEFPVEAAVVNAASMKDAAIAWINDFDDTKASLEDYLASEFKYCQELDEYEDDPYEEEYF